MNLPNLITVFRLLLIPVFVIFLLEDKANLALITFGLAGVSDAVDGFLARVLDQRTLFGAYVDPIADKLLLATAFVMLAILGQLPGWLAVVVVSRDVIILGGIGILMINNRPLTIKPTYASKITTFMQLITVCFTLGREYITPYWFLSPYLIDTTAIITVVSGLHYLVIGFQILGRPDRQTVDNNQL